MTARTAATIANLLVLVAALLSVSSSLAIHLRAGRMRAGSRTSRLLARLLPHP
jgi:hypothetical protein